jgi:hypothetical protein
MEQEMQEIIVHSLEQEFLQLSPLQEEVQEGEALLLKLVLLVDQAVALEEHKELVLQMQVAQETLGVILQLKAMLVALVQVPAVVAAAVVKMVMIEVVKVADLVVMD